MYPSVIIDVILVGEPSSLATVAVPTQVLHPPFTEEYVTHQTATVLFIVPAQGLSNSIN